MRTKTNDKGRENNFNHVNANSQPNNPVKKSPSKEMIKDDGDWECICGNTPSRSGFFPCDQNGSEVEPTPEEWTTNCYVCEGCGRIINQDTLHVVDRKV
jgi:hypothetical protein